jgi:superfamily II RNA helicase
MVKICDQPYPSESKYEDYFEQYPYPLSDFQKYAIEAIVEGNHVLVTAHTGSGKTLPAEFAINHFVALGKKIIYTSPIKALSNQKYYEFTQKYPHISFGLFTGDIKTNPNADVLIMTTEILMNYLFVGMNSAESKNLQFQIDINTDLGCVVFDEVHYINDLERGQVWEKTILMLPSHIQMVMLSATIDAPVRFASWCERGYTDKEVYLASTEHRVVPLSHYGFLTVNDGMLKGIKDKVLEKQIRDGTNKLILYRNPDGQFQENGYREMTNLLKILDTKQIRMKRQVVLNNLALFLRDREMLPAIVFVFSRKQVELCAHEITIPLLEDDSKVPYIVRRECEQIIRKLPNFREYLELPEYNDLVSLLEKGIGIHHSGMIPILREIVELMISKKYIKMLFATESFAIGLDCPIKTAVFSSLTKFDGNNERYLLAHEYTQMAGRAGRRGIDTIGHVVHCNNLFSLPTLSEYKTILGGVPQKLISKFRISYSLILNLLKNGKTCGFDDFAKKSMIYSEIQDELKQASSRIHDLQISLEQKEKSIGFLRTPIDICRKYVDLDKNLRNAVNKKRKEIEREISKIKDEHKYLSGDLKTVNEYDDVLQKIMTETNCKEYTEGYIQEHVRKVCYILLQYGFIKNVNVVAEMPGESEYELTPVGMIASNIAEIHPIIMANMIVETEGFSQYSIKQIIALFSCFTDVKVSQDMKSCYPQTDDGFLKSQIKNMMNKFEHIEDIENRSEMRTGINYENILIFDIIDNVIEWSDCNEESECKYFIQNKIAGKGISVGDFTKAILKIATITKECINVCEIMNMIPDNQTLSIDWLDLLYKLNQIEPMILKYITTSQSLYV